MFASPESTSFSELARVHLLPIRTRFPLETQTYFSRNGSQRQRCMAGTRIPQTEGEDKNRDEQISCPDNHHVTAYNHIRRTRRDQTTRQQQTGQPKGVWHPNYGDGERSKAIYTIFIPSIPPSDLSALLLTVNQSEKFCRSETGANSRKPLGRQPGNRCARCPPQSLSEWQHGCGHMSVPMLINQRISQIAAHHTSVGFNPKLSHPAFDIQTIIHHH